MFTVRNVDISGAYLEYDNWDGKEIRNIMPYQVRNQGWEREDLGKTDQSL